MRFTRPSLATLLVATAVGAGVIVAWRVAIMVLQVQLAEHDFGCQDKALHRELLALPLAHLAPPRGHLVHRGDCPWGFVGEGARTSVESIYATAAPADEVVALYRRELEARGFILEPDVASANGELVRQPPGTIGAFRDLPSGQRVQANVSVGGRTGLRTVEVDLISEGHYQAESP